MIKRAWGPKGWGAILSVLLIVFSVLALLPGCGQEQAKAVDPPKIADYDKPGTVFIATKFKADVTVNDVDFNEQALEANLLQAAASGQVATDTDSLTNWALNELIANPSQYIVPAATTLDYPDQESDPISGSGFIVNSDGYVVTNTHVVKMDDKELKQTMALSVLSGLVKQEVSDLESTLGVTLSDDQSNQMADALASAHAAYMNVSNTSSESWILMGGSANVNDADKGMQAEIVKVGEPSPGKDVAILKVNASNLPTVALGDDKDMREGDQAIAIGYPGAATFNPLIKQSDENIKPSMTTGTISGRKTMPGGWDVLQIDTAITHGNSGGPLFNSRGEVVGITTFGSTNENSQTGAQEEVQGFNFAVPVSIVKEFMTEANVTAAEGQLTRTYDEGVDLAYESHYSAAKEKFSQVQDSNGTYPYVKEQIATATDKISSGQDKSTFPVPVWLIVVIAIVIALAVIGAVAALLLLKRGKGGKGGPAPAKAAAPAGQPVTPVPPVSQPEAKSAETVASELGKEAVAPVSEEPVIPAEPAPVLEIDTAAAGGQTATLAPEREKEEQESAEPSGQPAFCTFCGKGLPPDARFCPSCAKPVSY